MRQLPAFANEILAGMLARQIAKEIIRGWDRGD